MKISTRPCLRLRTNLGPQIAFWGLIWVQFWSLFWVPFLGPVLGPYNYKRNQGPQNGAQFFFSVQRLHGFRQVV